MIPFRTSAAALLAAVALAALPATAVAHNGSHPFENCTEAYDNGYSNIPKGDKHYGEHLDRDKDGIGCDQPPSDFVPHDESDDGAGAGPAAPRRRRAAAPTSRRRAAATPRRTSRRRAGPSSCSAAA